MEASYQPFPCSLHDPLLAPATLRRNCTISYRDDMGQLQTIESLIQDVYTRDGAESMTLEDGTIIRLDRLVQIEPV